MQCSTLRQGGGLITNLIRGGRRDPERPQIDSPIRIDKSGGFTPKLRPTALPHNFSTGGPHKNSAARRLEGPVNGTGIKRPLRFDRSSGFTSKALPHSPQLSWSVSEQGGANKNCAARRPEGPGTAPGLTARSGSISLAASPPSLDPLYSRRVSERGAS